MGGIDAVVNLPSISLAKRLERQPVHPSSTTTTTTTTTAERQCYLKWLGRSSPKRDGGASPRQRSPKAEGIAGEKQQQQQQQQKGVMGLCQQARNSKSSAAEVENLSVRTRPDKSPRRVLSEIGRRINEQSGLRENSEGEEAEQDKEDDDDEDEEDEEEEGEEARELHRREHFKREFIRKLAEKAKKRVGYSATHNAGPWEGHGETRAEADEPTERRAAGSKRTVRVGDGRTSPPSPPSREKFSRTGFGGERKDSRSMTHKPNSPPPPNRTNRAIPWSRSSSSDEDPPSPVPKSRALPSSRSPKRTAAAPETLVGQQEHRPPDLGRTKDPAPEFRCPADPVGPDRGIRASMSMRRRASSADQGRDDSFSRIIAGAIAAGRASETEALKKWKRRMRDDPGHWQAGGEKSSAAAQQRRPTAPHPERTGREKSRAERPEEKENMMRSLKMAAAADQVHFLLAFKDNGAAVQSAVDPGRSGGQFNRDDDGCDAVTSDGVPQKSALRGGGGELGCGTTQRRRRDPLHWNSGIGSRQRAASLGSDETLGLSAIQQHLMRNATVGIPPTLPSSVPTSPVSGSRVSDARPASRRCLSFGELPYAEVGEQQQQQPIIRRPRQGSGSSTSGTAESASRFTSLWRGPSWKGTAAAEEAEKEEVEEEALLKSEQEREAPAASSTIEYEEQLVRESAIRLHIHLQSAAAGGAVDSLDGSSPIVADWSRKREITTTERTSSSTASSAEGSPESAGTDASAQDAGVVDQQQVSPVSVLPYSSSSSRKPSFQEDSRLSPLEHKLRELHERIHRSKREVTNQKRATLERYRARALELSGASNDDNAQLAEAQVDLAGDEPHALACPIGPPGGHDTATTQNIVHERPVSAATIETSESWKTAAWWANETNGERKWDLVYVRDVLLASGFGCDDAKPAAAWHSVTEPMEPSLFHALEDFYRTGKEFRGSQLLRVAADSDQLGLRDRIRSLHAGGDWAAIAVATTKRTQLFDAANEALSRTLVPHAALPHPWMRSQTAPVVRPRPAGPALLHTIWAQIRDQMSDCGSMAMDRVQLHLALHDLVGADLCKRSPLFPAREVERAAERVGLDLERWILDDLLRDTVVSLMQQQQQQQHSPNSRIEPPIPDRIPTHSFNGSLNFR